VSGVRPPAPGVRSAQVPRPAAIEILTTIRFGTKYLNHG